MYTTINTYRIHHICTFRDGGAHTHPYSTAVTTKQLPVPALREYLTVHGIGRPPASLPLRPSPCPFAFSFPATAAPFQPHGDKYEVTNTHYQCKPRHYRFAVPPPCTPTPCHPATPLLPPVSALACSLSCCVVALRHQFSAR